MCGFAGFAGLAQSPDEHLHHLSSMVRAIAHRGPDETGYYVDDHAAIGSVRLAIIDVPLGKQPMATADDRYWIAFNGEIFNYLELRAELEAAGHTFRTNSDTEVLLNALVEWDLDVFPHLNGQYGFVFYDRIESRLILGRDPFGERPVFYAKSNEGIVFASEIKGIFALPFVERTLSVTNLRRTCRFWAPFPRDTCFERIHAVAPGNYAVFSNGQLTTEPHYRLPQPCDGAPVQLEDAAEAVREAMRESVRLRLRSDFPVGAFVSGGIDSTIVAITAAEQISDPLRTFSLTFEQPELDESPYQRRVVQALGSDHTSVCVSASDVRELFPAIVRQTEMPIFRTAPVASSLLARATHAAGTRVVLSGEGGDELFAGYDIAKEAAFITALDGLHDEGARLARFDGVFADYLRTTITDVRDVVAALVDARRSPSAALGAHLRRFADEAANAGFLVEGGDLAVDQAQLLAEIRDVDPLFDRRSPVDRSLVVDLITLFCGYGLPCQLDRVGTLAALEVRLPFLDARIAEVAWSIPDQLRLCDGSVEKFILKHAFADRIPREITERPKQATRAPGAEALRLSSEDDWIAAALSDERLARSKVVDSGRARELVGRVHAGGSVRYPDTHAYLLLLSTLVLEDALDRDFSVPVVDTDPELVRAVDFRTTASAVGWS